MRKTRAGVPVALLLAFSAAGAGQARWQVWTLSQDRVEPASPGASLPASVGSLQKPWVLKAWAEDHGEKPAPEVFCPGTPDCWRIGGHGWLRLRRAVAESCNAYFRRLAESTPAETLERNFRDAGFVLSAKPDADSLIGLAAPAALVQITPARLLRAFRDLLREPWTVGETHRLELLRGLEEASRSGTAAGARLTGFLVKTGTASTGGSSIEALTGWVLAATPAGDRIALGRLEEATGRLAAEELGKDDILGPPEASPPAERHPPTPTEVSIWIFSALKPEGFSAMNLSTSPALVESPAGDRWIGQGGSTELSSGERLATGSWELEVRPYGLRRRFAGSIQIEPARGTSLGRARLTTSARHYVEGVLRAELRPASPERARELSAAILRFLKRGKRHGEANVCDRNHCAWFVGEGPDVTWLTPERPFHAGASSAPAARLDDAAWESAEALSQEPGPDLWTDHCGGKPLSEWEVWGKGSRRAWSCPRHKNLSAPWRRGLRAQGLETVFGSPIERIECLSIDGFRKTRISLSSGKRLELSFDELHRRLAAKFGWRALPSPPDRVEFRKGDWIFSGHGSGHRVGLCLSE